MAADADLSTAAQIPYQPSPVPDASYTVTAVMGPDGGGKAIAIDGTQPSRVLIGQSPACDLRVADPQISRRHVALEPVGRRLRLLDLGSLNGTFVNGIGVVEAFLVGGEELRLGGTTFRVERGPAPRARLPEATKFGRVIGWSREMRRLYPLCARLASSSVAVIIEGETGTGKEALAESLHEMGPRSAGPFVVFDCTAVPANLLESELFGHEKGAFTGAVGSRRGVFEQAHGGTLLIDEIGDLDLALQPKLLRAIERSEVRRVGGEKTLRIDVRVLAATRRDLDHEVQAGRFRDDLFHRLAVARIELPPLRERRGDVRLLAQQFTRDLGGAEGALDGALLSRWDDWHWPGNVRELRNAVARQLALGDLADTSGGAEDDARPSSLPPAGDLMAHVLEERLPLAVARQRVVDELERRYVEQVLSDHGGNVAEAAAASGIGRRYFNMLRSKVGK